MSASTTAGRSACSRLRASSTRRAPSLCVLPGLHAVIWQSKHTALVLSGVGLVLCALHALQRVTYLQLCCAMFVGQFCLHCWLQVSFVNSICTVKGGTHVDYIVNQISKCAPLKYALL